MILDSIDVDSRRRPSIHMSQYFHGYPAGASIAPSMRVLMT